MQTVCSTYWDAGKGNLTAQNTSKPFGGRGSAPNPAEGTYSAPANRLVGVEGLAVPWARTPCPALGPSGLASSTPHSKISSDAHDYTCTTRGVPVTDRQTDIGILHTARCVVGERNQVALTHCIKSTQCTPVCYIQCDCGLLAASS